MNSRQKPNDHALNLSDQHDGHSVQSGIYSGLQDGGSGTTESNELILAGERASPAVCEDGTQARDSLSENQEQKSMPTTMEAESLELLDRLKTDPFSTPMLLSDAQRILDLQLQDAEDKSLSFLDKRPTTAPFIDDVVRSMDMLVCIFESPSMFPGGEFTVEAFANPLSLAALFLAKHVTADRKLPFAIMLQLHARDQTDIAEWVEHSGHFAEELACFESGRGVSVPSKLFRHNGHPDHFYGVVQDPRPLVESGYEFNLGIAEPWCGIALMMHSSSEEAQERLGFVVSPAVPEDADIETDGYESLTYGNADNDVRDFDGEPRWYEGAGRPLNLADNVTAPRWASGPGVEFWEKYWKDYQDAALFMCMRGSQHSDD